MSNLSTILNKNNKRAMGGGNVKQGLVPQATGFYGTGGIMNMRRANLIVSNVNVYNGLRLINYNGSMTIVQQPPHVVIGEVTPVSTPTNDTTPTYVFSSTERGTIAYGGGIGSSTTIALPGNNTITLNALAEGTYNGSIVVTNVAGIVSNTLAMSAFTIDTTAPELTEESVVTPNPTNDTTPQYGFGSTEAGAITYGGGVSSTSSPNAVAGDNLVTFDALSNGTYTGTIVVTDAAGNVSATLTMTSFTVDATVPELTEEVPVPTPTNDTTPQYTFRSNEVGAITYGGGVSSSTTTSIVGLNEITLIDLADGIYRGNIVVTDLAGNVSNTLNMSEFTINTIAPELAEITPVPEITNDPTPEYVFSSTEAGAITYGGGVSSSSSPNATVGNNTITLNTLADGTYTGTIRVTDTAGNVSATLTMRTFRVDTTAPRLTGNPRPATFEISFASLADPTIIPVVVTSDEVGAVSYAGIATSRTTAVIVGDTTLSMTRVAGGPEWSVGVYNPGFTITVTDTAGNASSLVYTSFEVIR